MSDTVYLLVVASVLTVALIAQVGFAGYYAYRRQWGLLGRIGLAFLVWLVSAPLVFLFGVGICAAGCPKEPFEFILAALICTPSLVIVYWLFKRRRRHPDAAA
jgi:hypothetical protein